MRRRIGADPRALLIAAAVVVAGCLGGTAPDALVIHITAPTQPVEVGFTDTAAATVTATDGTPRSDVTVGWSVADTTIATVDGAGVLTGREAGSTVLRAQAGTGRDSVTLTIVPAAIASLEIIVPDSVLHEGDQVTLSAVAKDRAGRVLARPFSWTSKNAAVTVDYLGVVRTIAPGADTVTVSAGDTSSQAAMYVDRRYVAVAMSGNSDHTCVLTDRGETYCWGYNLFGQVGDGTTTLRNTPVRIGTLTATSLAVGANHTCALLSATRVSCWGENKYGALAQPSTGPESCSWSGGTMPCSTTPISATIPFALTTLVAGAEFTCGQTATGQAVCWGANWAWQLGDGTQVSRDQPDTVVGDLRFASITVGGNLACGLDDVGAAWCWGGNVWGPPTAVATTLRFQVLSTGDVTVCGVTADGAGYCWGNDDLGQLGDGGGTGTTTPQLVPGGLTWAAIAVGAFHACGLTTSGEIWCWGWLPSDATDRSMPISGPTHVPGTYKAVASGGESACGFGTDDLLYCWGFYPGDGSANVVADAPTRVSGQYLH